MKKLNTTVHVDGVAYGPDQDVPDEVAERITAPGVWVEPGLVETEDAVDTGGALARPAASASKADWVEFAVRQGVSREEADGLTRDELVERFPVEPVVPPAGVGDNLPAGDEKAAGRSGARR